MGNDEMDTEGLGDSGSGDEELEMTNNAWPSATYLTQKVQGFGNVGSVVFGRSLKIHIPLNMQG